MKKIKSSFIGKAFFSLILLYLVVFLFLFVFQGLVFRSYYTREKIKDVKSGLNWEEIEDIKIETSLEEVDHRKNNLSYQDALIIAMKKEKMKFKFYSEMAEGAENKECKETFLALASAEARHKLKFEIEYDEHVLVEN